MARVALRDVYFMILWCLLGKARQEAHWTGAGKVLSIFEDRYVGVFFFVGAARKSVEGGGVHNRHWM